MSALHRAVPELRPLLKAPEAARILGISERKLWELTNRGEIRCVRIDRSVRYDAQDLDDYIQKAKR